MGICHICLEDSPLSGGRMASCTMGTHVESLLLLLIVFAKKTTKLLVLYKLLFASKSPAEKKL